MKRKILLLFTFIPLLSVWLFTGCTKENTNNEYPDVTVDTVSISGIMKYKRSGSSGPEVVAWPFGEAVFDMKSGSMQVLATGTVLADGTFTLELPEKVSGSLLVALSSVTDAQGGNLEANPNTVRILSTIMFTVQYSENGVSKTLFPTLHTLNPDISVNKTYYYNLYDADGTFKGKGDGGNSYDWTFVKGWGLVESYITDTISGAFNSISVTEAPVEAFWSN